MGKLGRFACILTPMLLTLASMICCIVIAVSGTNNNVGANMYFFRINTTHISTPTDVKVAGIDVAKTGFSGKALGLQDFYTSYLWNYCGGNITGSTWQIKNCSSTSANYAFNPEDIVAKATNNASGVVTWPKAVTNAQKGINVAEKAMNWCYIFGFIATLATFVFGWFGLLSRWGSCLTTIFADAAFGFLFIASIIATAIFYSMKTAFNHALKEFNVPGEVGHQMMSVTWLAVAFSFGASFFWMLSTCCCSGRTSRVMQSGPAGRPSKYDRVPSPYMSGANPGPAPAYGAPAPAYGNNPAYSHNVEMGNVNRSYEPMRHAAV